MKRKPDICGRCDAALTDENWQPSYQKRRYLICKPCELKRQGVYSKNNPAVTWARNAAKKYGITFTDYKSMLEQQNNRCAICNSTDPKRGTKNFSVDHCHTTGKVRGLLCSSCNLGLGHFQDDTKLLDKAKEYLNGSRL